MPINYSKFDNIGDSDDDEPPRGGAGMDDSLQKLIAQLGEKRGAGRGGADPMFDPGDPYGGDDMGLLGYDDPYEDEEGIGSRALDWDGLGAEARKLLLARLVTKPEAASLPRALLLEAELHLIASRYRKALITALALCAATTDSNYEASAPGWEAPVAVIQMVCAYQLGDRDHAVLLRDKLQAMARGSLSRHLKSRFDGTSEILDFMPQFLNLLKASEKEGKDLDGTGEGRDEW